MKLTVKEQLEEEVKRLRGVAEQQAEAWDGEGAALSRAQASGVDYAIGVIDARETCDRIREEVRGQASHAASIHVNNESMYLQGTAPTEPESEHWQAIRKPIYDLVAHLRRQRAFSLDKFGPGRRVRGVIAHIKEELEEIEEHPGDVVEWIDVALLAFDGAWRAGFEPEQIAAAFEAKLTKNENRTWPDWRTADPDRAIEHVRTAQPGEAPGEGEVKQ